MAYRIASERIATAHALSRAVGFVSQCLVHRPRPIGVSRENHLHWFEHGLDVLASLHGSNPARDENGKRTWSRALLTYKPALEVDTVEAPSAWACYLVNGDEDGLEQEDIDACDSWVAGLDGWRVVDVERDEDGNPLDPRFTWSYRLYGGTSDGGEVLEYVVHRQGV